MNGVKGLVFMAGLCATAAAQSPRPPSDSQLREAVAQATAAPYRSVALIGNLEARRRIEDCLAAECQLKFTECSLRDVVARLADHTGLPIRLDVGALEDAGLDPDGSVLTGDVRGVPLRVGVRELLAPIDLVLVTMNDILKITTRERADELLEPRFYRLDPEVNAHGVIDLLQVTVAPLTWNTVGGQGAIELFRHGRQQGLVVSQTQETHENIDFFLANFQAATIGSGVDRTSHGPTTRGYAIGDANARDAVAEKLVTLCNGVLAEHADESATVAVVGKAIVVRSGSDEFHKIAEEMITAVQGACGACSCVSPPVIGGSF